MFLVFQLFITSLIVFIFLTLVFNLLTTRLVSYYAGKGNWNFQAEKNFPLVSILIPARDEALNIENCVRSLLGQLYPNFEIIVLDDNSQDNTASIIQNLILLEKGPVSRLSLVQGKGLPPGWLGKPFACHQLAEKARGDFFLFTDADTVHSETVVSDALAALEVEKADFLSLFPHHLTGTLAERLVVPLVIFYVLGLLPVWFVSRTKSPSLSAANGQFMFFRKTAYERIGGHKAFKATVLEDVGMGRGIKQAGLKQILPGGKEAFQCRMYRDARGVWQGFSKNLFAFFNFSLPAFSIFMLLNLAAFVLPYFWLLAGLVTGNFGSLEWFWLPLIDIILAWGLRLVLAEFNGFRRLDAFLHPVSILFMFAIGLNSVRWTKGGGEWKGRKILVKK